MKYLFGTLLLASSISAFAFEIKVNKMTATPGMDRSFQLHTKTIPDKMVLDCQSFVQGLTIGPGQDDEVFYYMDPQECEDLYGRVYETLKKRKQHCLDVGDMVHADYTCL